MGLLDVQIPQVVSSEASFNDQAAVMRSTISSADTEAISAQAFHQGESSIAFQTAHARFTEAAGKINALLDIASVNLGEAATTYVAEDSAAAENTTASIAGLPNPA